MKTPIKRIFQPEIRTINEEERSVEFVISTEAVDTYGTVFKVDGFDLTRYEKNPVVTYNHDDWSSNPDMVLGTSEIRKENGQLIAKAYFEDFENDMNEIAEKVWRKIKKGTLRMASIFAYATEGHWGDESKGESRDVYYFDRSELFGWSVVTHGANPDALKRSSEEIELLKKEKKRVSFDDFDARIFNINKSI
jgi:hypothetical protein